MDNEKLETGKLETVKLETGKLETRKLETEKLETCLVSCLPCTIVNSLGTFRAGDDGPEMDGLNSVGLELEFELGIEFVPSLILPISPINVSR